MRTPSRKFQNPSYLKFWNSFWYIKFSKTKFAKGNNSKKKNIIFKFTPGNLLIISYKLSKFEAPSCYNFLNILITKFHYAPLYSTKGDNPDLKKKYGSVIFDEESIFEISKPHL